MRSISKCSKYTSIFILAVLTILFHPALNGVGNCSPRKERKESKEEIKDINKKLQSNDSWLVHKEKVLKDIDESKQFIKTIKTDLKNLEKNGIADLQKLNIKNDVHIEQNSKEIEKLSEKISLQSQMNYDSLIAVILKDSIIQKEIDSLALIKELKLEREKIKEIIDSCVAVLGEYNITVLNDPLTWYGQYHTIENKTINPTIIGYSDIKVWHRESNQSHRSKYKISKNDSLITYGFINDQTKTLDLGVTNRICYYSLSPNAQGELLYAKSIDTTLIKQIHTQNGKVDIAITLNSTAEQLNWNEDFVIDNLIYNIGRVVKTYNFDGIVIDYQPSTLSNIKKYKSFIYKLMIKKEKINQQRKVKNTVLNCIVASDSLGDSLVNVDKWIDNYILVNSAVKHSNSINLSNRIIIINDNSDTIPSLYKDKTTFLKDGIIGFGFWNSVDSTSVIESPFRKSYQTDQNAVIKVITSFSTKFIGPNRHLIRTILLTLSILFIVFVILCNHNTYVQNSFEPFKIQIALLNTFFFVLLLCIYYLLRIVDPELGKSELILVVSLTTYLVINSMYKYILTLTKYKNLP